MAKKMPNLMTDTAFKKIFNNPDMMDYIGAIMETIIHEKVNLQDICIKNTDILTKSFTPERGKITDAYFTYNNYHILLEANNSYYKELYNLKIRYEFALFNNSYKSGEDNNNDNIFILVNINNFKIGNKGRREYYYRDEQEIILTDKLKVINIGLDDIKEKWDNGGTLSRQEQLFLFLKINHEDEEYVQKLIEGDEILMTLYEQIKNLSDDDVLEALFDKEEEDALELKYIKKHEREEGISEGKKENKIEMIKNMLKEHASLEFITKVSNTPIEEIKEIERGLAVQ